MVEFKNTELEDLKFGKNNFVEVARKVAITEDGENEFVSLSKDFTPKKVKKDTQEVKI